MTREEAIRELKIQFVGEYDRQREAKDMAIKALEQEPCDDTVSRGVFNQVMWERDTAIEQLRKLGYELGQKVEPCDDAVSRQALLDEFKDGTEGYDWAKWTRIDIIDAIEALPSVLPKREQGEWIGHREHCENLGVVPSGLGAYEWCSNCDCGIDVREWHRNHYNYCPNCGAEMR